MTWFELYMWTRLDAIGDTVGKLTILAWLALSALVVWRVVLAFILADELASRTTRSGRDNDELRADIKHTMRVIKYCRRNIWIAAMIAALLTVAHTSIPSKSDLALIQGMKWATNNADVRAIPDDAVKLIREWLNEARPNRKESKP